MKLLCECNCMWEIDFSSPRESVFQLVMFRPPEDPGTCLKCGSFRWVNPLYENMMHDLKSMNT